MGDPSICPKTRKRCDTAEVCWLIFCAKGGMQKRPISERDLTKEERYAMHMEEQKREIEPRPQPKRRAR